MTDEETVERLARAFGNVSISGDPWDEVELHEEWYETYRQAAREILAPRRRIPPDNGCGCSYCRRVAASGT